MVASDIRLLASDAGAPAPVRPPARQAWPQPRDVLRLPRLLTRRRSPTPTMKPIPLERRLAGAIQSFPGGGLGGGSFAAPHSMARLACGCGSQGGPLTLHGGRP